MNNNFILIIILLCFALILTGCEYIETTRMNGQDVQDCKTLCLDKNITYTGTSASRRTYTCFCEQSRFIKDLEVKNEH